MAVLKPKRIERTTPRSLPERSTLRAQRSTQESVPIHALQRSSDPRIRPLDMRLRDPQQRPQFSERPLVRRGFSRRVMAVGAIVALICAALVYVFMRGDSTTVVNQRENQAQTSVPITESEINETTTPGQAAQTQTILTGLAKHILLPGGGTPQVMQIMNPEELIQKDPFFAGSQSGDVLLIYKTEGKAIIYSPARDIIVNVGPVQVDPPKQQSAQ